MLATIESYFLSALSALSRDSTISLGAGPSVPREGSAATACIDVVAGQLTLLEPTADSVRGARGPARAFQRLLLHPTDGQVGVQLDFALPGGLEGEIGEVTVPSGAVAQPADDYTIDQDVIRFFRPPQGPVAVTLYGKTVHGYVSRRPCQINVSVRISAAPTGRTDGLLRAVVNTLLVATAELPTIEPALAPETSSVVRLRLMAPTAALTTVRRHAEPGQPAPAAGASAEWTIWGDLEETVALGTPLTTERIASVQYDPVRLHPSK